MPDHHSHNRGHLPVNRLFGGKEPVDLDDGLPSDVQRVDRRDNQLSESTFPVIGEAFAQTQGTQTPRGSETYASPFRRGNRAQAQQQNPAYFGHTIVDELASYPSDNSDIQAPADPTGDVLAELGALAATSAERERRRAAGDDGWRGFSSNASADVDKLCNAVYPADAIEATVYGAPGDLEAGYDRAAARLHAERATRASKAMAPPNICGAGPAGGDFAAVPRNTAVAKSAMVRIMELTALVEQARALAVQALTDIGSANQSELAAAHDRIATCERTITERDARIAALEAAAQSAIEKLAGGTE